MLILCALASASLATPASGRVEVHVERVGLPTLRGGDAVRNGAWTPILVTVSLLDQPALDGTLRVQQADADGDAAVDSVEVHLRADSGGTQRSTLYVFAQAQRGECRFTVELYDESGEAVDFVSQGELVTRGGPAQQPGLIGDDAVFLLSVSRETVGRIRDFVAPDKHRVFSRYLNVGHVSPEELPDLWIGLESVDHIVWDDARPEDLSDRQLAALLEWVNQGGTLLLAASRTAGSVLLNRRLAELLPAEVGELVVVDNLPDVRSKLLGAPRVGEVSRDTRDWHKAGFPRPIPVALCKARDAATVVSAESGSPAAEGQRTAAGDVVTQRNLGRGRLVFSGVALGDLFSGEGEPIDFFARVFRLREVGSSEEVVPSSVALFDHAAGYISFATRASVYLLLAGAASVAYVLMATFGSWSLLVRRGWQRHSWSVFALAAVAVSILAMMVVGGMRGIGERLHQLAIVDVEAGGGRAFATVLLGLKTSADKRVDVWLPPDVLGAQEPERTDTFLRVLPASGDPLAAPTRFADPGEYGVVPSQAVLEGVRIRATLKQFEGRWSGFLPGTLSGEITIREGMMTSDSYVINQLGVDLTQCFLVQSRVSPEGTRAVRDNMIQVLPIGDLPSGAGKVLLADRAYRPGPSETMIGFLTRSTLREYHAQWSRGYAGVIRGMGMGMGTAPPYVVGEERKALMLLSTIGEFDPAHLRGALGWMGGASFSRDRLRWLDLSERLDVDSVYLIGFTDSPGPARLFLREGRRPYRPVEPDPGKTLTVYRVRIPVKNLGTGPLPKEDESEDGVDSLLNRFGGAATRSTP